MREAASGCTLEPPAGFISSALSCPPLLSFLHFLFCIIFISLYEVYCVRNLFNDRKAAKCFYPPSWWGEIWWFITLGCPTQTASTNLLVLISPVRVWSFSRSRLGGEPPSGGCAHFPLCQIMPNGFPECLCQSTHHTGCENTHGATSLLPLGIIQHFFYFLSTSVSVKCYQIVACVALL